MQTEKARIALTKELKERIIDYWIAKGGVTNKELCQAFGLVPHQASNFIFQNKNKVNDVINHVKPRESLKKEVTVEEVRKAFDDAAKDWELERDFLKEENADLRERLQLLNTKADEDCLTINQLKAQLAGAEELIAQRNESIDRLLKDLEAYQTGMPTAVPAQAVKAVNADAELDKTIKEITVFVLKQWKAKKENGGAAK